VEAYGTYWHEDLLSSSLDAHGEPTGFLYALKHLHRTRPKRFNINRVVSIWEEGFDLLRTVGLRKKDRLVKLTGKRLPEKADLLTAAFCIAPDGEPGWSPPESLRVGSSEGILRKIVFPRMAFDQSESLDAFFDIGVSLIAKAGGRGAGADYDDLLEELGGVDGTGEDETGYQHSPGGSENRGGAKAAGKGTEKQPFPLKGCGLTAAEENRYKAHAPRTNSKQEKCYKHSCHSGCDKAAANCPYAHAPIQTKGGCDPTVFMKG
jgi:hypothetical protein